MQWLNSTARYGAVSQLLHWLTAVFVVAAWLLGQFGDDLPKAAQNAGLFALISLGLGVLLFLVARLGWRPFSPPPPPIEPARFGGILAWAATIMTAVIYLLLLAIPILGVLVQFGRGHDLPIFGLWSIPSPWPADKAFAHTIIELHELLANILMILVVLHAAAALLHHRVLGDRTLIRMLPGRA
jgi:cytochrome b561